MGLGVGIKTIVLILSFKQKEKNMPKCEEMIINLIHHSV